MASFEYLHEVACAADESGTTATVILAVALPAEASSAASATAAAGAPGEIFLVCANVGDSHAFAYTGASVARLNADHRLDANKAEVVRVLAVPGSSVSSKETAVEAGPLRLYPGGLMMSRTIGDRAAPAAIATPEVRIAWLPPSGGRVILASDGLWDVVSGKQASKLAHSKPAQASAQLLVTTAQKKESKDDITVTVVDVLPKGRANTGCKLPWSLPNGLAPCNSLLPEVEDSIVVWDSHDPDGNGTHHHAGSSGDGGSRWVVPERLASARAARLAGIARDAARVEGRRAMDEAERAARAAEAAEAEAHAEALRQCAPAARDAEEAEGHAAAVAVTAAAAAAAFPTASPLLSGQAELLGSFAAFALDGFTDQAPSNRGDEDAWTAKPKKMGKKAEAAAALAESALDAVVGQLVADAALGVAHERVEVLLAEQEARREAQAQARAEVKAEAKRKQRERDKLRAKEAKERAARNKLLAEAASAAAAATAATIAKAAAVPGAARREAIGGLSARDLVSARALVPRGAFGAPLPPALQVPLPPRPETEGGPVIMLDAADLEAATFATASAGWGDVLGGPGDGGPRGGPSSSGGKKQSPSKKKAPAAATAAEAPPGLEFNFGSALSPSPIARNKPPPRGGGGGPPPPDALHDTLARPPPLDLGSHAGAAGGGGGGGASSEAGATRNLHVSRYAAGTTREELRQLFSDHVTVLDVVLKEHPAGGYAFVNTASAEGAASARATLHGSLSLGALPGKGGGPGGLKVSFAKDRFSNDRFASSRSGSGSGSVSGGQAATSKGSPPAAASAASGEVQAAGGGSKGGSGRGKSKGKGGRSTGGKGKGGGKPGGSPIGIGSGGGGKGKGERP